mgnify:CR=1 FL=1
MLGTISLAGLAAGALDLAYVLVFFGMKGVGPTRVLHGIAAGLIGRTHATDGGIATATLGLAIHFAIGWCVAAVFFAASRRIRILIERPIVSGLLYGVAVWLVMNLVVLPLTANPPASFPSPTWLPVVIAHLFCVGLPIALVVRWRERVRG